LRRRDAAFRAFAGDEAEADGEKTIAPQRIARRGVARDDARPAHQHVGEPALFFQPEQFFKRSRRVVGEVAPFFLFGLGGNFFQQPQQANPQNLNLDGITFARRAGGIIRVHPGEMARTPDERGIGVHADAVRRALGIIFRDARQHVADGAAIFIHAGVEKLFVRQIFAHDGEPQRRVGGVAVGNVVAVNRVRQRAVLFKFGEREQQLFHFVPCPPPKVRARKSASRGPSPETTDNRR
jgi:hypothetical protein